MSRIINLHDHGGAAMPDLGELTSFRLRRLTNMYTKASASVYERLFDLTLNEWRVVALLHDAGTLSMLRLAERAQFDRGLTSRTVGALIERGLISREADARDTRAVVLALTDEGRKIVGMVAPVAYQRNEQLLSCLTKKEREVFELALEKLTHQGRVMLDLEREQALGQAGKDGAA